MTPYMHYFFFFIIIHQGTSFFLLFSLVYYEFSLNITHTEHVINIQLLLEINSLKLANMLKSMLKFKICNFRS